MNVLALETATSVCSVALLQDDRIVTEITLNRPRAHAENLVQMVRDSLGYATVRPEDLDAVAVSSGPGSYTGLRIGVSTAKGLAAAVDAALVSVPSLQALSAQVTAAQPGDQIAAAFDARRTEVYVARFFVSEDGTLDATGATEVVRIDDAATWLGNTGGQLWLVGAGWRKITNELNAEGVPFRYLESTQPCATAVARIGLARLSAGQVEDLVTFEPYYLKEFVAEKPRTTAFEKLMF